eukprot:1049161-Amphidinium_carterae.1
MDEIQDEGHPDIATQTVVCALPRELALAIDTGAEAVIKHDPQIWWQMDEAFLTKANNVIKEGEATTEHLTLLNIVDVQSGYQAAIVCEQPTAGYVDIATLRQVTAVLEHTNIARADGEHSSKQQRKQFRHKAWLICHYKTIISCGAGNLDKPSGYTALPRRQEIERTDGIVTTLLCHRSQGASDRERRLSPLRTRGNTHETQDSRGARITAMAQGKSHVVERDMLDAC